jgi:1-aminocyclopropane-1-carboxylate deaminase/D-cysteine desulfhydrase-like pyridoxal-dependent ACC family enzyme
LLTLDLLDQGIDRLELGLWPTPVQRLNALSDTYRGDIWIKRDGLSGATYGGNKVRKLEYLLAAAKAQGADHLVTIGGNGSNHIVATAIYGRTLGLKTSAVTVPQPECEAALHNIERMKNLQVNLRATSRPGVPWAMHRLAAEFDSPYVIGPGGSSPLGTLGYVRAVLELRDQIDRGELPQPKAIYVPLGSGGTVAGLALGCAIAELDCQIVAVRVVEKIFINGWWVRSLAGRTLKLLRKSFPQLKPAKLNLRVINDQFGGKYGRPTQAAERMVALLREREDIGLETTYTGKAMAALLADVEENQAADAKPEPLLFWNTYNNRDGP